MSHHLETAQRLREKGHRLTPQRLAVLEVIKAGPGHMTVNEVLERLRPQYPTLTIPTVYRNLQWLWSQQRILLCGCMPNYRVYNLTPAKPSGKPCALIGR